jgi:hypothetical protein
MKRAADAKKLCDVKLKWIQNKQNQGPVPNFNVTKSN